MPESQAGLQTITALVDASLVQVERRGDGLLRYKMLEVIPSTRCNSCGPPGKRSRSGGGMPDITRSWPNRQSKSARQTRSPARRNSKRKLPTAAPPWNGPTTAAM